MFTLPPVDTLLLADASAGDYATGAMISALLGLGAWIRSLLKDRAEQREKAKLAEADAAEKAAKLAIEVETSRAALQRTAASDAAAAWEKYSQETVTQLRQEIERVQKESSGRATRMNEELKARDARIDKLEQSERDCLKEQSRVAVVAARQEKEIEVLHRDMRMMLTRFGGAPPGTTMPVFLTAGAEDGIIRDCSPQAGAMFHWNRSELIGQSVEVLIPPEARPAGLAALARVARGERKIDPDRMIQARAMRRDGERFPVLITLTSWTSPSSGKLFIGAEIRDDVMMAGVSAADVIKPAAPAEA